MKNKWRLFFQLCMLIFTSIFLVDFFQNIDFEEVGAIFSNFNIYYFILASLLYSFMNFIRTLRYNDVYQHRVKTPRMFSINSYQNMLNHVIPYRFGELSHVYFMKNEKISIENSISGLLFVKLLDFSLTGLIFFVFSLFVSFNFERPEVYLISAVLVLFFSIFLLALLFFTEKIQNRMEKIRNYFNKHFHNKIAKIVSVILEKLEKIAENISFIRKSVRIYYNIVLTILIRLIMIVINIIIFKSVGIDLVFYVIIINDLLLIFVEIIPISLFANIGLYEWTFTILITIQNIPLEQPYNIGFVWHLFLLLISLVNVIVGFAIDSPRMLRKLKSGRNTEDNNE